MAYTFYRAGTGGDYSSGANWTGGFAPQSGDIAIIQSGAPVATNVGMVGQLIWVNDQIGAPESAGLDLIGSSIGPSSVLLLNANGGIPNVVLHNSALEGQVFAGSGRTMMSIDAGTSAVNSGWIGVASSQGPVDLDLRIEDGNFANVGAIQAGPNGSFSAAFGLTGPQFVGNWGVMRADPGGSIGLITSGDEFGSSFGTLVNFGQIQVEGGSFGSGANLLQSSEGVVSIKDGGRALIYGKADGGTIKIEQGILDLGDVPGFMTPEPDGPTPPNSNMFHSDIEFTGYDGSIEFGSRDIQMAFDDARNEIAISTMWNGMKIAVATVNLGDNRDYVASQFSVSGETMTFHSDTLA